MLLPFIEQGALSQSLQWIGRSPGYVGEGGAGPNNAGANNKPKVIAAGPLPMTRCPSSPGPLLGGFEHYAHYAGISGSVDPATFTESRLFDDGTLGIISGGGMMIANQGKRIGECSDGTSNTLLIGEMSGRLIRTDGTLRR